MIKASLWLKAAICSFLCAVFIFGIFGFNNDSKIKNTVIKNTDAAGTSCKGPADVILVIDRSASMNTFSRFDIAKTASVNFIDKLFAASPDDIYGDNAYHQVGLVAFQNLIDNEELNKSGDYIKNVINQSDGILGDAYPVGYRRTSLAISTAKDSLDSYLSDTNPSATKTMIIITDGPPYYNPDDAIAFADSAKSNGVRIISVGLKLDSISDEVGRTVAEETAAEEFIKNIASAPFDCYYASDSGAVLAGCNSISAGNLTDALDDVYNSITAAICDEESPTVSISREPSGTLYNVDNLIITSTATDDVGFNSHSIRWSDNWSNPGDIQVIECGDLAGTVIECNTGNLGPFSSGTSIDYKSSVTDANENEATTDLKNVIIANVDLDIPELLRNVDKTISATIYDSNANADSFFVTIKAKNLGGEYIVGKEIIEASMDSCGWSGSNWVCSYTFNPGCDWTDGITGGFANNIYIDVYFYAQSDDVGIRQIASSENKLLTSSFEGSSWTGTCTDGINNDCDYDISNDPIIDSEETLCDISNPIIGISRDPVGDVYDLESDGVTPMTVALTSVAGDDIAHNNGIKQHIIKYKKEGDASWTTFDCTDGDPDDGKIICNGVEITQSIVTISIDIGPFNAGEKVYYYSTAIDYSGNNNTTSTVTESFIVKNRECEGVGDLDNCLATLGGKCCGEICNASISNPNSYSIVHCAEEVCNEISWEWGPANDTVICSESGEPTECHSFSALYGLPPGDPPYFYDGGCEERAYRCSSGYCDYGSAIIKEDYCIGGGSLILNDYECSGTSCILNPDPAVENDICDVTLDSLSINAYNSDSPIVLISGSSGVTDGEVLDNLTNRVSLRSSSDDVNGISEQKIYWKKNTDTSFSVKDCDVSSCGETLNPCNCAEDIGPFNIGEIIEFYALSKDDSPNQTEKVEGSSSGLRYYYYDGTNFDVFKGSDIDTNVSHSWGSGKVFVNGNSWENNYNYVSIVWDGAVSPDILGEYTFYVNSDDGIRLYLNGNLQSLTPSDPDYYPSANDNPWSGHPPKEYFITYDFTSLGSIPIRIEWYEGSGGATMQLGWEPPSGTKVYPIPAGNLTAPYSFTVRDHECYDVPGGNKTNLTPCNFGSGMCCGGTCDSSISSTSYDPGCFVDSCSGTNWVSVAGNENVACGVSDTCFDYYSSNNSFYSGCITGGNECSSGYCVTSLASDPLPFCSENLLTNYDCNPDNATGSCQVKDVNKVCSEAGNYDSDSVPCNCDCDNYDIEEKVYSSLSFDGVDDYVEISDDDSLDIPIQNSGDITMEAWIYPLDLVNDMSIISKHPNYKMQIRGGGGGELKFATYGWTSSGSLTINNNEWSHVVITYNGTSKDLIFYINGASVVKPNYIPNGGISSGKLLLGEDFNGFIDNVRIYNRALYPEEVKDHYNGMFADDTGLVGHWDFDPINAEETNEIAGDRSGKGNDGILSNVDGILHGMNDSDWVSGKYGNGLDFDGSNDYVDCGNDIISTGAYTKTVWFKRRAGNNYNNLISGYNYNAFWVHYGYNFKLSAGHNSTWNIVQDPISTEPDVWYFGAVTFDPAIDSGTMKLYKNGKEVDSAISVATQLLDTKTYISAYRANYHFNGQIDEVRIYNRALSAEEIAEHYDGIFNNDISLVGYWDFNESSGIIAEDSSGNGPQWVKYGNGDDKDEDENVIDVLNRNVPAPWQVCTDGKNNDCDEVADDYDSGIGISNCDGEVDGVFITTTAMNRACVIDEICIEGSDLFPVGNVITVDDIDIERAENNFTISSYGTNDEFLIKETMIEWTTDNWANKSSKICEDTGICEVHVCEEGSDCILSSSLSAGNVFSFRVCAWDNSVNSNNKCTDYYNIIIENSNSAPEVTNLSIRDHNFCIDGLEYVLEWVFSDFEGHIQKSYEIQIKEGDNDFSTGLVIDIKKTLPSPYYQILRGDFEDGKEMEYGEDKNYYWRIKVTDSCEGGYEETSEWVEYNDLSDSDGDGNSATFTTPLYNYPQVDFSAKTDLDVDCLYETGYEHIGTEVRCDFGENITFSDESIYVNCDSPSNAQCTISSVSKCDVSTGLCVSCDSTSQCVKFGAGYKCEGGICNPPDGFVCNSDNSDCKAADTARCEEGACVSCDDDSQCSNEKFDTTGINYFCNSAGVCDDSDRREWYFYGNDIGDPDSVDPNPINNYIESENKKYYVILKVKDIVGKSCYKIKKILLGGRDYPKWNESSVYNN